MLISTKGRYGLLAMLDLAMQASDGLVTLNSIAARQNISLRYLEQMFGALRKAGLLRSTKGAQGGYMLGDLPSKITVGMILRTLEGDISVVDEEALEDTQDNPLAYCIRLKIWERLNNEIAAVIDHLTLDQLIQEYRKMKPDLAVMFFI
jgi:Rrf2 family protein